MISIDKMKPHVPIIIRTEELQSQDSPIDELPQRDRGKGAIIVLVACLLADATTIGFLLSYGVFQEYYTTHFADPNRASWIGVLSNGIIFLGAPAVTYCCQEFKLPRKHYIWSGFCLCVLSLLISAFVHNLAALIVFQGFFFGLGTLLIESPLLIILNTWFHQRRGLAYGLLFGGADLLGAAFTFLTTKLLHTYGLRATFLVYAAIIFTCAGPAICILQERVVKTTPPITECLQRSSTASSTAPASITRISPSDLPFSPSLAQRKTWPAQQPKKRYYQRGIFYVFALSNLLQACAIYLPFIYLPTFAFQTGHSKGIAALILAVGNVGMLVGDLSFGKLSDMIHVNLLIFISSGVSAIVTLILWGLFGTAANSQSILIAFSFVFGIFGGGFIVLWARMGTLFGERDAAMVYSTLSFGRGVGNILSGPVSQVLVRAGTTLTVLRVGQYGALIVFIGSCLTMSAVLGLVAIGALWWKKEGISGPEEDPKSVSTVA